MASDKGAVEARQPASTAGKTVDQLTEKAQGGTSRLILLGMLAGIYIGFGGMFATVARAGTSSDAYGPAQVLAGFVFALGLILVVVGGAELFTGNTMQVVAVAEERIDTVGLARSWAIVWVANLVGSLVLVALAIGAAFHTAGDWAVGAAAVDGASGKAAKGAWDVLFSGILANMLVCLAVWLAYAGRSATDRILGVSFPIAAFVAMDLEHSVANMFILPFGLAAKESSDTASLEGLGLDASETGHLTVASVTGNIGMATVGNIVGGAFIGLVYWWVYRRDAEQG
jgi:formate transporter